METRVKVWKWNRQHSLGQLACVSCVYPRCVPSRSAGWPQLTGVRGFREVLRGTGGPLSPPHGGVVQRKQRAPTRQFPEIPPVPWRPAVPAAFHGNSDVCWIHSGQGAVQGKRTRSAAASPLQLTVIPLGNQLLDCFDVGLIKPTPIWTRLKRIKNVLKSYVCTQIWSVTNSYNPALWLDLEESRSALTYNGVAGRTMWTRSCKHQNNSPEFIWVILYSS